MVKKNDTSQFKKIKKNIQSAKLTDFEKKVLTAVLKIPRGQTRSYLWVAREIQRPLSARAVGQALAKNPFLITVPCHRVVCSDGSLGGYAQGQIYKRRLLRSEQNGFESDW
jgi:O-6-methylguanine DNA methyltransferase